MSLLLTQLTRDVQPMLVQCWASVGNTRRSPNVGTMLVQRRRRWANIVPTLAERLVFAGNPLRPDAPGELLEYT